MSDRLPYDVCRCHDAACPERTECARWLQRAPENLPNWARLTHAETLRHGEVCEYKIKETPCPIE